MSDEQTETKTLSLEDLLLEYSVESYIQCTTITINPEVAERLLKINTTNRPLGKADVRVYANEMLRGKWKLNGEPIIFGEDSNGVSSIISGQHRLHAVILANKIYNSDPKNKNYANATLDYTTVAIYGVSVETADTVDQGVKRKHAHVLYRDEWIEANIPKEWNNKVSRKVKWCNTLATAARIVWLRAGGATVSSAPKFIPSEMLDFIKEDHVHLCKFVSAILSSAEEEGGGLKISLPYIAGLCYVASLNEDGTVDKGTMDTLLDAMLNIAQNQVTAGTAEHALVAYWNKLFSTPGSKDRDLDITGPFVKALNAIINGDKVTAAKLALTPKEKEGYVAFPPLLAGWDEACFVYATETKARLTEEAVERKKQKEAEREANRLAKEEENAKKEAEKLAAMKEVQNAKSKVPVKSGVMSSLASVVNTKKVNSEVSARPMIKRKPVPAKS